MKYLDRDDIDNLIADLDDVSLIMDREDFEIAKNKLNAIIELLEVD